MDMKNYICCSIEVVGHPVSNHLCYFVFTGKPFLQYDSQTGAVAEGTQKNDYILNFVFILKVL